MLARMKGVRPATIAVTGLDRVNAKTRETDSIAHVEGLCTIGRLLTPNSQTVRAGNVNDFVKKSRKSGVFHQFSFANYL